MSISIGIIGAGISGLATAYNLREQLTEKGLAHSIAIYEKSYRPGGSIYSDRIDGFLVEWGPNGFLNNEPATLELVDKLGMRDRLVISNDSARKRFILIGGRLRPVPTSPPGFIKTDIIPFRSKLRFAIEPFIRKNKADIEESVADFVRRRFGKMAVDRMFDPLMSGIYAGDVEKLSIHSTLKVFSELEREHGSVVKGMIKRVAQRRKEKKQNLEAENELLTTSKNPMMSKLMSFRDGMGELIISLANSLKENIRFYTGISSVSQGKEGYQVEWNSGNESGSEAHDIVILAAPPRTSSLLVEQLNPALAAVMKEITSSTIAVVALGYEKAALENGLDGFGYLIPRKEGLRSLGVLWSSSIFERRADKNSAMLTVMIGGAHDSEAIKLDDKELIACAISEFESILRPKVQPVMTKVMRHVDGIPQYNLGHQERLEKIESILSGLPGLHLSGNGYHGISANDCLRGAKELSDRIMKSIP